MTWYEEKPKRLLTEIMLVKKYYPSARICRVKGSVAILLRVQGRKNEYSLRVEYPKDFPYSEPKAFIDQPRLKNIPHRWSDNSLCIEGDVNPPETSGKIIMDWSINWIRIFESWCDTGKWPKKIKGE